MPDLPSRADIFANALTALDAARGALSEARDWLQSDWQPTGSSLTSDAGAARLAILRDIGAAKNLIDTMKDQAHRAVESLDATTPPAPKDRQESDRSDDDSVDDEYAEIVAEVGARRRAQIITHADAVATDIRADTEQLGTAPVDPTNRGALRILGLLPPQTFAESAFWRHQLATAADNLRDETLRWGAPIPRCTGEEMVLYLILQRAQKASRSPNQWYNLFEILFQDEDVLMLYDMPPEAAESIADAVNLAPNRWFTEFTVPFPVPDR